MKILYEERSSPRWLRVSLLVLLFFTVLARLVWLQVRDFDWSQEERSTVTAARVYLDLGPRCRWSETEKTRLKSLAEERLAGNIAASDQVISYAYYHYLRFRCRSGDMDTVLMSLDHEWLVVATLAFNAVMIRAVAGSWVLAWIHGAVMLSRGSFVDHNMSYGLIPFLVTIVSCWFATVAAFFRTGWRFLHVSHLLIIAIACFASPAFAVFYFAWFMFLCILPLLRETYLRAFNDQWARARISAHSTDLPLLGRYAVSFFAFFTDSLGSVVEAREPFVLWVARDGRRIALLRQTAIFVTLLLPFVFGHVWRLLDVDLGSVMWSPLAPMDVHMLIACLLVLLGATRSPKLGLLARFETCSLLILTLGSLYLVSVMQQNVDRNFFTTATNVFILFEPTIHALALCMVFDILLAWRQARVAS